MSLAFLDDIIEEFHSHKGQYKPAAMGLYGGKFNALDGLLPYIFGLIGYPVPTKTTVVDVFTGSGVVPLNIDAPMTIINDKDEQLVNFLRIFLGAKFKRLLKKYPEAPECVQSMWRSETWKWDSFQTIVNSIVRAPLFYWMFQQLPDTVSQAVAYYIGNRNNFSNIPKIGFDYIQARRKPWDYYHYKHFRNFCLTRDVRVWDLDFRKCIEKVNDWATGPGGNAFIYCDPPYIKEQGYQIKFTEDDLRDLSELLKVSPHPWIMSNEDSDIVRLYFKQYNIKSVRWSYTCAAGATTAGRHELLISNRPFVKYEKAQGKDVRMWLKK